MKLARECDFISWALELLLLNDIEAIFFFFFFPLVGLRGLVCVDILLKVTPD